MLLFLTPAPRLPAELNHPRGVLTVRRQDHAEHDQREHASRDPDIAQRNWHMGITPGHFFNMTSVDLVTTSPPFTLF